MRRSPLFMKAGKFKSRIWWRCYDWIMKKNPFSHGCCKKFECYRCMLELFFWKNCQLTGNHKFFGSCLEFFNSSVTNQEEDVLKMLSINHFKRKKTYKNTWFYSASINLRCASKLVTHSHSIFIAKMETNKLSSTYPPQGTNYRAQCVQFL